MPDPTPSAAHVAARDKLRKVFVENVYADHFPGAEVDAIFAEHFPSPPSSPAQPRRLSPERLGEIRKRTLALGASTELLDHIEAMEAELVETRIELKTAWANEGVGGYCSDAPESLYLFGLASHGCDAWMHAIRAFFEDGKLEKTMQEGIDSGMYTQPVKYVRADLFDRLAGEVRSLREQLKEKREIP